MYTAWKYLDPRFVIKMKQKYHRLVAKIKSIHK